MGKPSNNQIDVDEMLNSDEASMAYASPQGELQAAVMGLNLKETINLLGQKVNPNNVLGQQSFIVYAMNRHVNSPAVRRDPQKQETSQAICFALLDHGARLGHTPLDHRGTLPALRDTNLWHNTAFGAQVMFHAMDYALAHGRTVPYLSISHLYSPPDANPARGADRVLQAFGDVTRIQQQVARWLEQPVDDLTARVAGKLPAGQRSFWSEAAASAGKPVLLNL